MSLATVGEDTAAGAGTGAAAGPWGAAIGAGIGLIGGLFQNSAQNAAVSQQEAFQQQMSSTAYQRQVSDMDAAGLNPMFAIGSGGASSPAGSVAQVANPIQQAMGNAAQITQLQQAQQGLSLQAANTAADIGLKKAQATSAEAQAQAATAAAKKTGVDTGTAQYQQSEERVKSKLWDKVDSSVDWTLKKSSAFGDIFQQIMSNKYNSNAQQYQILPQLPQQ